MNGPSSRGSSIFVCRSRDGYSFCGHQYKYGSMTVTKSAGYINEGGWGGDQETRAAH